MIESVSAAPGRRRLRKSIALLVLLGLLPLAAAAQVRTVLTSFKPQPSAEVRDIAIAGDGGFFIAGDFDNTCCGSYRRLAHFRANGAFDYDFPNPNLDNSVYSVLPLPDGKILVGGKFDHVSSTPSVGLARFNADGTFDTGFASPLSSGATVYRIVRLSTGKILVGGNFTATIGGNTTSNLVQFQADGTLDTSFGAAFGAATDSVRAIAETNVGNILIGGRFDQVDTVARRNLALLLPDHFLGDADYGVSINGQGGMVSGIVVQGDGRFVVVGDFTVAHPLGGGVSPQVGRIVRFNADGSIDDDFLANGAKVDHAVRSIHLQADGKILLGGEFTLANGLPRSKVARLLPSGEPEADFAPPEINDAVDVVAEQPDGGVLAGGAFTSVGGDGGYRRIARLLQVAPMTGAKDISAGAFHTCVRTVSGAARCWGSGTSGKLGTGGIDDQYTAVAFEAPDSLFRAIDAGGGHTCAVTPDGAVECVGFNEEGAVGGGDSGDQLTPVVVAGLSGSVQAVALGQDHSCALTTAGAVQCWGRNDDGQLGNGTTDGGSTPVQVVGLTSGVRAISAGDAHTCALTEAGAVKCWGDDSHGQIGDGTATGPRLTPTGVVGLDSGVEAIDVGGTHACALRAGAVQCWGDNDHGQIGDGSTTERDAPTPVSGLSGTVVSISAGGSHSCAADAQGQVQCWGSNQHGQIGNGGAGGDQPSPVAVAGLSDARSISAGGYHTCAVTGAGATWCWGYNAVGQLGNGGTDDSYQPTQVLAPVEPDDDVIFRDGFDATP